MSKKIPSELFPFLDSWLGFQQKNCHLPGMVVAIAHQGKIIFNKAYGYANLEKKTKLTPKHIFRIASHSKTFTATAIMQLAEQKKLHIDDHLVDYLPWLKQHKDKRFSKVTIRQLMSHSAGVIRDGLNADYWQMRLPYPDSKKFKKSILEASLVFDTNTKMKYSNYGFALLGEVILAVSGQPYNEYVKDNIIRPLRLKNTGPEFTKQIQNKIVTGYTRRENGVRRPVINLDTKAMSSAYGFYSTAEDLCHYFSTHALSSNKLLNAESKKEMQRTHWHVTNSKNNQEYGLGFTIDYTNNGRRLFGHGGGFIGQITKTGCDSKEQTTVVILTNGIDTQTDTILKGIYSVIDFFQKNGTSSRQTKKKFAGRFMSLWEIFEIVSIGKRIVTIYPNLWQPFSDIRELEYINKNTLKITKANGYDSEGELIHFHFNKSGTIKSVRYAGHTCLPEKDYLKQAARQKLVNYIH